jgi:hypothetical protein
MSSRMKRDCPHCHESMAGDFLHWRKFAKQDYSRACPLCGKDIRLRTYPEEVAVRALTIALVLGGAYLMKHRGSGYLAIFAAVVVGVAAGFALVHLRLRNAQRFEKGRLA